MNDYVVYQSQYISTHQFDILEDINVAQRLFDKLFPGKDTTWTYDKYNIFSLTAPSTTFYEVYREIKALIRKELGNDRPLWMQAWLNYHTQDQLLTKHAHESEYHGYICIEPMDTKTVFDGYEIINKPGQIYFGPGKRDHWVEAINPFNGVRTTIGFDVLTIPDYKFVSYTEKPFGNMGIIPL